MAKLFRVLREQMSPEAQARAHEKAQRMMAEMPLHELRRARELSQQALAERLHIKQAAVSKMERGTDMYISTLRGYIEAMGGSLEVVARFPDGDMQIKLFSDSDISQEEDHAAKNAGKGRRVKRGVKAGQFAEQSISENMPGKKRKQV